MLTAYKAIPAPAALSLTGPAPQTIQTPVSSPIYVPDPDTLALTGSIPVVLANQTIPVPQGTLAFTGRLPTGPITGITQVRDPLVGTLTFSGPAPALNFFLVVSPGAGSVRFSGPNPALTGAQFGTGNTLYPTWQSRL